MDKLYHPTSSSDDSDSTSDTEEERYTRHQTTQSVSLGQMTPVYQRNTTVQTDYIRSYSVMVHSRDRNLFREHLFSFRLFFGTTSQNCTYSTCDPRYRNTHKSLDRRCAIEHAFTNVQSMHITDILLPHAAFLQSIIDPFDNTKTIPLTTPIEVLVQLTPSNGKPLLGTNQTSRRCSFACAQVATSNSHSRYKTLHHPFQHDTPINVLNNMMFQLHQEQERLVIFPFAPENTPDTHAFHMLTYQVASKTIVFTIQNELKTDYIQSGQVVSFRDMVFVKQPDTMNPDEKALYDLLKMLQNHSCVVVNVDENAKTITVDVSVVGIPLEHITSNTSLDTQFDYSILLNESMQYSCIIRFECVEHRLKSFSSMQKNV